MSGLSNWLKLEYESASVAVRSMRKAIEREKPIELFPGTETAKQSKKFLTCVVASSPRITLMDDVAGQNAASGLVRTTIPKRMR